MSSNFHKLLIFSGLTLFLACLGYGARERCLRIKTVEPIYLCADEFKRISEYLTGRENRGWDCVLRTCDEDRGGMYFIVNLNVGVGELARHSQFVLNYVRSDNGLERRQVFTVDLEGVKSHEVYLGLTGEDWPGLDVTVVAWRLVIEDLKGNILAQKESFAWRMPDRGQSN